MYAVTIPPSSAPVQASITKTSALYRAPRLRARADGAIHTLSVRLLARTSTHHEAWGAAVRPRHRTTNRHYRYHTHVHSFHAKKQSQTPIPIDAAEDADTQLLLRRAPACAQPEPAVLAPLAKRWGIPLAAIMRSEHAKRGPASLLRFYRRRLRGKKPDLRVCLLLNGKSFLLTSQVHTLACDVFGNSPTGAVYARHPLITGVLLASATGAHGALPAISARLLRQAGVATALAKHECIGGLDESLLILTPTRVGMCLTDLSSCTAKNGRIKLIKLITYCNDRSLLTNRAIAGVFSVHVKQPNQGMTKQEFITLFAALVDCGKPASMRYWFYVLDVDADGHLGPRDIADFYRSRKRASESKNGILLASAKALWDRLSDMVGGKKLTLRTLLSLTSKQREFILCALLVRRPDDGHLVDLRQSLGSASAG